MNKHKRKIATFALLLFVAGAQLIAKPAYHLIKRKTAEFKAEQRWKKVLNSKSPKNSPEAAWLSVPAADINTLILNSEKEEDLMTFPIFAKFADNLKIIIAHRDIHFNKLEKLKQNDQITLQLRNSQIDNYTVTETEIIEKINLKTRIRAVSKKGLLALVTCYPFHYIGHAPKRYIVWCRKE